MFDNSIEAFRHRPQRPQNKSNRITDSLIDVNYDNVHSIHSSRFMAPLLSLNNHVYTNVRSPIKQKQRHQKWDRFNNVDGIVGLSCPVFSFLVFAPRRDFFIIDCFPFPASLRSFVFVSYSTHESDLQLIDNMSNVEIIEMSILVPRIGRARDRELLFWLRILHRLRSLRASCRKD